MPQPVPYSRATSFTNYQTAFPFNPLSGADVDEELNRIQTTTDQLRYNLDLIQRDDGRLENRSVGYDQLAFDVLNDLGGITGLRYVEYTYDIPGGAINEVQQLEVDLSDFNDAITGGAGTGIGFDIRFDYLGTFWDLTDAVRQSFSTADLQTALETNIPALAGNISLTTNLTTTTQPIWNDALSSGMPQFVRIEFINALANTNVAPITLTFHEPATTTPIAETPIVWSEIQAGAGLQTIISGVDRYSSILEYAGSAPISIHVNGLKADPADYTAPDGQTIIYSPGLSGGQVVSVQVGEAATSTENLETVAKLDDISSSFNGSTTTFPILVGAAQQVILDARRLTISINDVIQEPTVDFDVDPAGENIIFTTAPKSGDTFWGLSRYSFYFGAGSITNSFIANGTITGEKIADGTIGPEKLNFAVNDMPVGAAVDYYDDTLPAEAASGTYAFPVGQTCGKCGSGADIEDDDIEIFFNKMKKRWGNVGTEDFNSLDLVLLPDLRGTTMVVPDKGKGKVVAFNTVGVQSGLELLPTRRLVGTASASGTSGGHALTIAEMPSHDHNLQRPLDPVGDGFFRIDQVASSKPPYEVLNQQVSATGGNQPHDHSINVAVDHSQLFTNTDRIMQPYTCCEKIIRLK